MTATEMNNRIASAKLSEALKELNSAASEQQKMSTLIRRVHEAIMALEGRS